MKFIYKNHIILKVNLKFFFKIFFLIFNFILFKKEKIKTPQKKVKENKK